MPPSPPPPPHLWLFYTWLHSVHQVKLRAMQAHQDRVEQLKLHGEQIIHQFRSTDSIKEDLQSFTQRWQKAFKTIGKYTLYCNVFLGHIVSDLPLFSAVSFIVVLYFCACSVSVIFCKCRDSAGEMNLTEFYPRCSKVGPQLNQMREKKKSSKNGTNLTCLNN